MPLFKKKLKDTKIGKFLSAKAPEILEGIGDILPDKGVLGIAGNIIDRINKSDKLTPEDKEMALKLLEMDTAAMEQVSKRWESDMKSDSWLSKNVRPIVCLYLLLVYTIIIVCSFFGILLKKDYLDLTRVLLEMVFMAYFVGRTGEKLYSMKK